MAKHSEYFVNFRHKEDNVTWWNDFNKLDDKDYGTVKWVNGKSHKIESWKFTDNGKLKDEKGNIVNPKSPAVQSVLYEEVHFQKAKAKLKKSGGKLSHSEKVYLDSEQAIFIANGLTTASQTASDDIKKNAELVKEKASELFAKTKVMPPGITDLSPEELADTYSEGGVREDTIVTPIETFFDEKVTNAQEITTSYINLQKQIESGVQKLLEEDSKLAGEFKEWSQY
ncbi:TPA: hypothetical protein VAW02_002090 [Streptococcus agalactiae]|nr:hypothetical protein [Streptococcus agalactiae]